MTHPTDDQLLLHAYGELPEPQALAIESHIAACSVCADQMARFERGRVALDVALPAARFRPAIVWATAALVAAAVVAGVLFTRSAPPGDAAARAMGWNPTTVWSATAGYVAGGHALVDIDAQLTRLEQERSYGLPN
jgi:anti-sigma factor RsiW